jgi:hypothetical protein
VENSSTLFHGLHRRVLHWLEDNIRCRLLEEKEAIFAVVIVVAAAKTNDILLLYKYYERILYKNYI